MKVVLFCGGMGMRLREYSENIPKPMVNIGYRPILWNVMRYYAHFGFKDFILCLGYRADLIKNYFVNYDEYVSNDFVFSNGGKSLDLLNTDIDDWNITFVDTGLQTNIGERLRRVQSFLQDDEVFLANYSDGLTDMPLPKMIDHFYTMNKIASFMAYQPTQSFHVVELNGDLVKSFSHIGVSGLWINAGYFILHKDIFKYMKKGEELVNEPFQQLIHEQQLVAYKYNGFWTSMDTFKDKQLLDDLYAKGKTPWRVWESNNSDNIL